MWLIDYIGLDLGYIVVGLAGFSLILLISLLVANVRISKLIKKYKKFMGGQEAKTLEEQFINRFNELDVLQSISKQHEESIEKIQENLLLTYQKVGIVKYDAFKEMGGKLSFALALLNGENDGYILNSMHSSREGCYTYIKEIIKGESYVMLSEEEKLALAEAKKHGNYIG
ncbi:MAG: hypothetical protein K0S61_1534 [Anaerocolumna sp.]|jgi:hypothetical protein|nr:hypothetical protein [Anaerocolumna sp.]